MAVAFYENASHNLGVRMKRPDRSYKADAERFRWLLKGNGYYMEENSLCGNWDPDSYDQDYARRCIDEEINSKEYKE